MARKKLTVNLGNLTLTDSEYKKLMAAIHKTVSGALRKTDLPAVKKRNNKTLAAAATVTATISATFKDVNPGLSELSARHNNVTKKLTQSGTLTFDGVLSGDSIRIQGKSLGTAEISVDIPARPQTKKFDPGTFIFNFNIN